MFCVAYEHLFDILTRFLSKFNRLRYHFWDFIIVYGILYFDYSLKKVDTQEHLC